MSNFDINNNILKISSNFSLGDMISINSIPGISYSSDFSKVYMKDIFEMIENVYKRTSKVGLKNYRKRYENFLENYPKTGDYYQVKKYIFNFATDNIDKMISSGFPVANNLYEIHYEMRSIQKKEKKLENNLKLAKKRGYVPFELGTNYYEHNGTLIYNPYFICLDIQKNILKENSVKNIIQKRDGFLTQDFLAKDDFFKKYNIDYKIATPADFVSKNDLKDNLNNNEIINGENVHNFKEEMYKRWSKIIIDIIKKTEMNLNFFRNIHRHIHENYKNYHIQSSDVIKDKYYDIIYSNNFDDFSKKIFSGIENLRNFYEMVHNKYVIKKFKHGTTEGWDGGDLKILKSSEHPLLKRIAKATPKRPRSSNQKDYLPEKGISKIDALDDKYIKFNDVMRSVIRIDIDGSWNSIHELEINLKSIKQLPMPNLIVCTDDVDNEKITRPHLYYVLNTPIGFLEFEKGKIANFNDLKYMNNYNSTMFALIKAMKHLGADEGCMSNPMHGKNPLSPQNKTIILEEEPYNMFFIYNSMKIHMKKLPETLKHAIRPDRKNFKTIEGFDEIKSNHLMSSAWIWCYTYAIFYKDKTIEEFKENLTEYLHTLKNGDGKNYSEKVIEYMTNYVGNYTWKNYQESIKKKPGIPHYINKFLFQYDTKYLKKRICKKTGRIKTAYPHCSIYDIYRQTKNIISYVELHKSLARKGEHTLLNPFLAKYGHISKELMDEVKSIRHFTGTLLDLKPLTKIEIENMKDEQLFVPTMKIIEYAKQNKITIPDINIVFKKSMDLLKFVWFGYTEKEVFEYVFKEKYGESVKLTANDPNIELPVFISEKKDGILKDVKGYTKPSLLKTKFRMNKKFIDKINNRNQKKINRIQKIVEQTKKQIITIHKEDLLNNNYEKKHFLKFEYQIQKNKNVFIKNRNTTGQAGDKRQQTMHKNVQPYKYICQKNKEHKKIINVFRNSLKKHFDMSEIKKLREKCLKTKYDYIDDYGVYHENLKYDTSSFGFSCIELPKQALSDSLLVGIHSRFKKIAKHNIVLRHKIKDIDSINIKNSLYSLNDDNSGLYIGRNKSKLSREKRLEHIYKIYSGLILGNSNNDFDMIEPYTDNFETFIPENLKIIFSNLPYELKEKLLGIEVSENYEHFKDKDISGLFIPKHVLTILNRLNKIEFHPLLGWYIHTTSNTVLKI